MKRIIIIIVYTNGVVYVIPKYVCMCVWGRLRNNAQTDWFEVLTRAGQ